ncbi:MAG TPA: DUF2948 family protein [Methyloceanibacter sp.]|jgi:Protein of unknown function (DUF2948)|nr:DUF2948 family protein [Methyloceanibacter sp.]
MEPLKLIALDEEDLAVLSSLLQDAVLRVADMSYLPKQKRFAAALNRFEWEGAAKDAGQNYRRRRAALRFDRVFNAKLKNVKPQAGERVLSLLAVAFTPKDAPSGTLTLTFSGDASIQLEVECIEAELKDLGPEWRTRSKPAHPGEEPDAGPKSGAGSAPGAGGS